MWWLDSKGEQSQREAMLPFMTQSLISSVIHLHFAPQSSHKGSSNFKVKRNRFYFQMGNGRVLKVFGTRYSTVANFEKEIHPATMLYFNKQFLKSNFRCKKL